MVKALLAVLMIFSVTSNALDENGPINVGLVIANGVPLKKPYTISSGDGKFFLNGTQYYPPVDNVMIERDSLRGDKVSTSYQDIIRFEIDLRNWVHNQSKLGTERGIDELKKWLKGRKEIVDFEVSSNLIQIEYINKAKVRYLMEDLRASKTQGIATKAKKNDASPQLRSFRESPLRGD